MLAVDAGSPAWINSVLGLRRSAPGARLDQAACDRVRRRQQRLIGVAQLFQLEPAGILQLAVELHRRLTRMRVETQHQ